jgi:hypothetical protein
MLGPFLYKSYSRPLAVSSLLLVQELRAARVTSLGRTTTRCFVGIRLDRGVISEPQTQTQHQKQHQQQHQQMRPMSDVVFRAWKVDETDDGSFVGSEQTCSTDSLRIRGSSSSGDNNTEEEGFVLIKVTHSSLNYKDAMSASGNKGVTRSYPHTPGIDAAGTLVGNNGGSVLVTGYVRMQKLCTVEKDPMNLSPNGLTHSLAHKSFLLNSTMHLSIHSLSLCCFDSIRIAF